MVLTYRGQKYTQIKDINSKDESVLLKYRGIEVLSKRAHEAMTSEIN